MHIPSVLQLIAQVMRISHPSGSRRELEAGIVRTELRNYFAPGSSEPQTHLGTQRRPIGSGLMVRLDEEAQPVRSSARGRITYSTTRGEGISVQSGFSRSNPPQKCDSLTPAPFTEEQATVFNRNC